MYKILLEKIDSTWFAIEDAKEYEAYEWVGGKNPGDAVNNLWNQKK